MRLGTLLPALVACIVIAAMFDCGARADRARREPAEVTIARFLCGEADGHKVSAGGLLWTMKRRAEHFGLRFTSMLAAYSAPLRGAGGRRGRWVRALPVLPTARYADNWRDAIDAARSFIAGTLRDPCERATFHFGSEADIRARFPHAVPVDCGDEQGGNVYISEDGS